MGGWGTAAGVRQRRRGRLEGAARGVLAAAGTARAPVTVSGVTGAVSAVAQIQGSPFTRGDAAPFGAACRCADLVAACVAYSAR